MKKLYWIYVALLAAVNAVLLGFGVDTAVPMILLLAALTLLLLFKVNLLSVRKQPPAPAADDIPLDQIEVPEEPADERDREILALKQQLANLNKQVDRLSGKQDVAESLSVEEIILKPDTEQGWPFFKRGLLVLAPVVLFVLVGLIARAL